MSADADFVRDLTAALHSRAATISESPIDEPVPNPFKLTFSLDTVVFRALIHVRRVTPQSGSGTGHNRPEGEWHAQMIFDDSVRGAGVDNVLQSARGYRTLLLGFTLFEDSKLIVAWDPAMRRIYRYSRSLQVREPAMHDAAVNGMGQHQSQNGEIVNVFRTEFLPEYMSSLSLLHGHLVGDQSEGPYPTHIPAGSQVHEPPREGVQRGRRAAWHAIRDVRFKAFVSEFYPACVVCDLAISPLLEAAHIIPVSDPRGSDHYSNGLRLCRNCHSLYDSGLLLISGDYLISFSRKLEQSPHFDRFRNQNGQAIRVPGSIPMDYRPDPVKLQAIFEERKQALGE